MSFLIFWMHIYCNLLSIENVWKSLFINHRILLNIETNELYFLFETKCLTLRKRSIPIAVLYDYQNSTRFLAWVIGEVVIIFKCPLTLEATQVSYGKRLISRTRFSSFSEKFTTTRKKTFAANTFMRMSFSFEEQALNLKKKREKLSCIITPTLTLTFS